MGLKYKVVSKNLIMIESHEDIDFLLWIIFIIFILVSIFLLVCFLPDIPKVLENTTDLKEKIYWLHTALIQANATLIGFFMVFIAFKYGSDNKTKMTKRSFIMLLISGVSIYISFLFSTFVLIYNSSNLTTNIIAYSTISILAWLFVVISSILFFIITLVHTKLLEFLRTPDVPPQNKNTECVDNKH